MLTPLVLMLALVAVGPAIGIAYKRSLARDRRPTDDSLTPADVASGETMDSYLSRVANSVRELSTARGESYADVMDLAFATTPIDTAPVDVVSDPTPHEIARVREILCPPVATWNVSSAGGQVGSGYGWVSALLWTLACVAPLVICGLLGWNLVHGGSVACALPLLRRGLAVTFVSPDPADGGFETTGMIASVYANAIGHGRCTVTDEDGRVWVLSTESVFPHWTLTDAATVLTQAGIPHSRADLAGGFVGLSCGIRVVTESESTPGTFAVGVDSTSADTVVDGVVLADLARVVSSGLTADEVSALVADAVTSEYWSSAVEDQGWTYSVAVDGVFVVDGDSDTFDLSTAMRLARALRVHHGEGVPVCVHPYGNA